MFALDVSEIAPILVVVGAAFLIALILGRRTVWNERRIVLVAAMALPGAVIALATALVISVFTTPADRCGVDACGMAATAAMSLILLSLIAFAFSLVSAQVGYWVAKR